MEKRPLVLACRGVLLVSVLLALPGPAWPDRIQDAETSFNAGLSHLREGRSGLALEEFKRAVAGDPRNPYFFKGLGLAYASERKYADAVDAFRKALAIIPYYVDVRNDLGTALILAGRRQEGKAEFLAAFNDPTNPTPEISSRNLGQAYFEEKNHAEAFNWFRTSVGRNKAYHDAYLGLSDALVALGRAEESITFLQTAAKECADVPAVRLALGEAYFNAGRFHEARKELEETRRKDPAGPAGRRAADILKQFPK